MALSFSLRGADASTTVTPLLAVLLPQATRLPTALRALDEAMGGALRRTLTRKDFRGARDETLHLEGAGARARRVLLVGMGTPGSRASGIRRAASIAARQAHRMGVGTLAVWTPEVDDAAVESIVIGVSRGAWEWDMRTPPPPEERRAPLAKCIVLGAPRAHATALAAGEAIAEGHALARRLAHMPGNLCTPDLLADTAREIGQRHGMEVKVFGRADLEKLKMGSFLSVAQGTPQEPRMAILEHRRGPRGAAPIVLVGKGLCFDTGGISIKPAERMEFMKYDMSGAAGVLGAMEAIGRLGLAVNVIGVFGATTNMPSGTAVKPGDVVTASSGRTIEVINTDAEGRLVLADLLAYVARYKPAAVLDAATLTGAVVIALGNGTTGVMGSDTELVEEVLAAGARSSEPGWQLPLPDEYKELIKSDVADLKNTGGRAAGSITAALFLREFAEGYPWVHLDIAGTAYSETDLVAIPRGPTGVPVGTFVEFVRGRAG
jgi:leucyl aminopeptidase